LVNAAERVPVHFSGMRSGSPQKIRTVREIENAFPIPKERDPLQETVTNTAMISTTSSAPMASRTVIGSDGWCSADMRRLRGREIDNAIRPAAAGYRHTMTSDLARDPGRPVPPHEAVAL
jgi:hypothetical protein